MPFALRTITVLLCAVLSTTHVIAQENEPGEPQTGSPDDVFAIQGEASLTQAEIDAAFSQIPAEYRLAFIRDGERVNKLLIKLLRSRLVADAARAAAYDKEMLVQTRMTLAAEKELAEAWIAHVVETAPEADYEALAYEYYLVNPDKFTTEASVDVSHILISSETRPEEEALARALEVRQRLLDDPASFDALVEEYSEDPGKASNGGRYPRVERGQMVKPFEEMAFSMQTPGEISEPVKTTYGYHVIRLNQVFPAGLTPFESVKAQSVKQAREKYLSEYRIRYLRQLSSAQIELPDGAVEAMVKRYFGENLELAPDYAE